MEQNTLFSKRIALFFLAILLVGGGVFTIFWFTREGEPPISPSPQTEEIVSPPEEHETEAENQNPMQTGTVPAPSAPTKDALWNIWVRYWGAAEKHDTETLRQLSYHLSPECADAAKRSECEAKMDAVVRVAPSFRKENLSIAWIDNRQAIFFSDFTESEDEDSIHLTRSRILFARNAAGEFGLLALDPSQEWSQKKNSASSTEEARAELRTSVADTDQDGQTDNFEKCIFPDNLLVFSCTETDPLKRDSDGDGWWDGVEMYFQSER